MTFLVYHAREDDIVPSLEGIVEIKDFNDLNKYLYKTARKFCNTNNKTFRWGAEISFGSGKNLIDELASVGEVDTYFCVVEERGEYNYILIKD